MKKIIAIFFTVLIYQTSLKSQPKLSTRQEKLNVFLRKYRDAVKSAPDSLSKFKITSELWKKRIIFIQDTLKFSISTLDTFYFEKAYVKRITESNKKYIEVLLLNKYYGAITTFDITQSPDPLNIPICRMLLNLKQNGPVLAVINLQDLWLNDRDVDKGIKQVILTLTLKSIYNIK